MNWAIAIPLILAGFMAGLGLGARQARLDYEPLIEHLLKVAAEDLEWTRQQVKKAEAINE